MSTTVSSSPHHSPPESPEHHAQRMKDHAAAVAVASSTATVITKSVLHPLDTLKCRFQMITINSLSPNAAPFNKMMFASPWQRVRAQFRGKWGLGDLYGGLPPKLLLYVPYQTLYITTYDSTRYLLLERERRTAQANQSGGGVEVVGSSPVLPAPKPYHTVLASVAAEFGSCVVRVPMEAMKMWVQSTTSANSLAAAQQLTRIRCWSSVWNLMVPQTLMHDIPYSVSQWLAYEALRPWARRETKTVARGKRPASPAGGDTQEVVQLSAVSRFLRTCVAGGSSGLVAAVVTIPLDHIRTRGLVLSGQRLTAAGAAPAKAAPSWRVWEDLVVPVYREHGVRGFYRGGAWRVVWVTANMTLYFPIFEFLRGHFATPRAD